MDMTATTERAPDKRKRKSAAVKTAGLDGGLVDHMREWRRVVAKRAGMPAYVIMHDSTLEEICRRRPSSTMELLEINGIGVRKAEMYGSDILSALGAYGGP
jgi:superfamily II DNA helicase RecQ